MVQPRALQRALGVATAALLTTIGVAAAQAPPILQDKGVPQWTPPRDIPVGPSTQFTWQDTATHRGIVKAENPFFGGWALVGDMLQFRNVPSWSGDPTLEVILYPPYSGHPTKLERFLVQFPVGAQFAPPEEKGLVVGFHPYSISEKSVFNGTTLPYICAEQGWILVAAYGLIDTHFGNMPSQDALDAVIQLVHQVFKFNPKKVYTVGFSMGGGPAVNWALRHQDPAGFRVAGAVVHTGTLDLIREYTLQNADGKALMSDADHFGATPTQDPFAYEEVSAFQMVGQFVDPNQAYVDNLRQIPIYVHWNSQDPNWQLVQQTNALAMYLQAQGFDTMVDQVSAGGQHSWSTLDMRTAFDWLKRYELPRLPKGDVDVHATHVGSWLYTEVRGKAADEHARFSISSIDTALNTFALHETHDLDELAIHVGPMGLTPTKTLRITHTSGDASTDTIVLKGYPTAPSSVQVNFSAPHAWSHDPLTGEVTITPTPDGAFAIVQVTP